jgi:arsenate reductase (thioredoxin)
MPQQRVKVLFVCIGNSCRSPMAEAIARKDAALEVEASSAGLAPLGFVAQMTRETLIRNGYSADALESKPISVEAWRSADIVINMSGRPKERAFRFIPRPARVEDWEIDDPYGDAEKYQGTYESIRLRVHDLAARLRKEFSASAGNQADSSANAPGGN